MDKEFVPYQESLELKELGFDEPCLFAFDNCSTPMRCSDLRTNEQKFNGVNYNSSTYTSQPTFSQAFRWFRENYLLFGTVKVDQTMEPKFCYSISRYESAQFFEFWHDEVYNSELYYSYEEAELDCLINLIKIVKNK